MSRLADTQRMAELTAKLPLGSMAAILGARGGAARKRHPQRKLLASRAAAVRWKNHKAANMPNGKNKSSAKVK